MEFLGIDPEKGLLDTGLLVHLAMLGYVAGFVLKNQIALRFLVLGATFLYIAYYYYHPAEPLWGAIFASLMILVATVIGLARILFSRMRLAVPAEQIAIYDAMTGLQPGEFRRLMRLGEFHDVKTESVTLTVEGEMPDRMYFIVEGDPKATKNRNEFDVPLKHFIGEISFVLGCPASATVTLPSGGRYVSWEKDRLRAALARSADLERAFEALLTRDMASKVQNSVQIEYVPGAAPIAA